MGVVHEAEHVSLGGRVALKFLKPEYAQHAEMAERFLREARSLFHIRSDHVVRVLDVDVAESGAPFMVMELLEGPSLAELLDLRRRLSPPEACSLAIDICEALTAAHALGIVHRDVKPQNVIVTAKPNGVARAKLLDFGIALTDAGLGERLTMTEAVIGTPSYMSPEQLRALRLTDVRTDIWAVGVMLYEMLMGRLPWIAESVADLAVRQRMEQPPALRLLLPHIPAGLENAVAACLSVDVATRMQSAVELAAALRPFAAECALESLRAGPRADDPSTLQHRKVYATDGGTAFAVAEPVVRGLRAPSTVNEQVLPASGPRAPLLQSSVPPPPMTGGTVAPAALTASPPSPATTARTAAVVGVGAACVATLATLAMLLLWRPSARPGLQEVNGIAVSSPAASLSASLSESGLPAPAVAASVGLPLAPPGADAAAEATSASTAQAPSASASARPRAARATAPVVPAGAPVVGQRTPPVASPLSSAPAPPPAPAAKPSFYHDKW